MTPCDKPCKYGCEYDQGDVMPDVCGYQVIDDLQRIEQFVDVEVKVKPKYLWSFNEGLIRMHYHKTDEPTCDMLGGV